MSNDQRIGTSHYPLVFVGIVELTEKILHAIKSGTSFIVRLDHSPGSICGVRIKEHRLLGLPWGGWSFGLSYSIGPFTVYVGRGGWYRGGWWGPSRYRGYRHGYRRAIQDRTTSMPTRVAMSIAEMTKVVGKEVSRVVSRAASRHRNRVPATMPRRISS
jgi:hypothetical protein